MSARLLCAAMVLALGLAGVAAAEVNAVAGRQAILKGFGKATPGAMLQGKEPFDLAKAQAALATYQKGAAALPLLFPSAPSAGATTDALPVIWRNKRDFEARFAKLAVDARAASMAIRDEASFRAEFPKLLANCKGCHTTYRAEKPAAR